jgi:hypothetical protein
MTMTKESWMAEFSIREDQQDPEDTLTFKEFQNRCQHSRKKLKIEDPSNQDGL